MVQIRKEGNKVIIEADLDGVTLSSTGKSVVLATTNGFTQVPGSDEKVSLNIIRSRRTL